MLGGNKVKAQGDPQKVLGTPSDLSDQDALAFLVADSKFRACLFFLPKWPVISDVCCPHRPGGRGREQGAHFHQSDT